MSAHEQSSLVLAPGVQLLLVYVPAGEFVMGDDAAHDPEAWDNEVPRHRVYLDSFWIGKYPVTVTQFATFLRATEAKSPDPETACKREHPMTNVNWREATAFCEWASRTTHQNVHLPSEAQWEKAARGADGRRYPWGLAAPDHSCCNYGSQVGATTAVGAYSPQGDSPYHCADMLGNVWEWCADWYDRNYYKESPARNPTGPIAGTARVLRGGAWWDEPWVMRCAFRSWLSPSFIDVAPGFRVVVAE